MAEEQPTPSAGDVVNWTASEFIAHEKGVGWYVNLLLLSIVLTVVIYLITHDAISAGVVIVGALFLAVYAGRQPRQLQYQVDDAGLTIGEKRFGYNEFRSFSIAPEGAFTTIVLMPLKRFAATKTLYYAPEDEERIVAIINTRLPIEERRTDAVEHFMRRIRF